MFKEDYIILNIELSCHVLITLIDRIFSISVSYLRHSLELNCARIINSFSIFFYSVVYSRVENGLHFGHVSQKRKFWDIFLFHILTPPHLFFLFRCVWIFCSKNFIHLFYTFILLYFYIFYSILYSCHLYCIYNCI